MYQKLHVLFFKLNEKQPHKILKLNKELFGLSDWLSFSWHFILLLNPLEPHALLSSYLLEDSSTEHRREKNVSLM